MPPFGWLPGCEDGGEAEAMTSAAAWAAPVSVVTSQALRAAARGRQFHPVHPASTTRTAGEHFRAAQQSRGPQLFTCS